jgi:hypothetical protein
MTFDELTASIARRAAPADLPPPLRALWLDATGDWSGAHDLANEIANADGARIHAYLHRKEGDLENALYWYRQARRPPFEGSLDQEWTALVRELLGPG